MTQILINKCQNPETMPGLVLDASRSITQAIEQRAFDLYGRRNGGPGSDFDDWLQAERDVVGLPTSELVDDEKEFRARVAVPGFDAKDIQISATPDALLIQADSTHTHQGKSENVRFSEFSARQIFRRLDLPESVDVEKVTATLEKGILQVTAPKAAMKRLSAAA